MPLAEISGIKTRQFDGGKVAALVASIAVVVGGIALVGASQPMF